MAQNAFSVCRLKCILELSRMVFNGITSYNPVSLLSPMLHSGPQASRGGCWPETAVYGGAVPFPPLLFLLILHWLKALGAQPTKGGPGNVFCHGAILQVRWKLTGFDK